MKINLSFKSRQSQENDASDRCHVASSRKWVHMWEDPELRLAPLAEFRMLVDLAVCERDQVAVCQHRVTCKQGAGKLARRLRNFVHEQAVVILKLSRNMGVFFSECPTFRPPELPQGGGKWGPAPAAYGTEWTTDVTSTLGDKLAAFMPRKLGQHASEDAFPFLSQTTNEHPTHRKGRGFRRSASPQPVRRPLPGPATPRHGPGWRPIWSGRRKCTRR